MTLAIENSPYGYDIVIDGVRVSAEALSAIIQPSDLWLRFTRTGNDITVESRPGDIPSGHPYQ